MESKSVVVLAFNCGSVHASKADSGMSKPLLRKLKNQIVCRCLTFIL